MTDARIQGGQMKLQTALATVAAGVLSLALVAPAAAAVDFNHEAATPAIAPAGPGDNGKPEDAGKPEDPGQPGEPGTGAGAQGRPDGVGPASHQLPELPENASPRATAAVEATYERFAAISARIDAIRALAPGPDRNAALNELFADFSGMLHTVSDAVQAVDAQDEDDEGDGEAGDLTLTSEGDEDGDSEGDSDTDADTDEEKDKDKDEDPDDDDSDDDDAGEDDDDDDDQDDEDSDDEE